MKADPKILDLLNEVLTNELTAINQYFLHARTCSHWGYKRLGEKIYKESVDEMRHADKLVERILFLEGLPNLQRLGKINVGENVLEILKNDLAMEMSAIPLFRRAIIACRDAQDNTSEHILIEMLKSEEEHVDWLEEQLELVRQMGEAQYLAEQIRD